VAFQAVVATADGQRHAGQRDGELVDLDHQAAGLVVPDDGDGDQAGLRLAGVVWFLPAEVCPADGAINELLQDLGVRSVVWNRSAS
jgi:hypothetical protein